MIFDLIGKFFEALQQDDIRVKRPTRIFLCGGEIPDDRLAPTKSARHFFFNHLHENHSPLVPQIVRAEDLVKNADISKFGFKDLLQLEELVAEIVAVILLFVESPGSFAELGAFTANDAMLNSLVAVIDNKFRERTSSFVYLGPIKRLLNHNEDSLLYASWLDRDDEQRFDVEQATKMATDLSERMPTFLKRNGITGLLSTIRGNQDIGDGERMCLITGLLDVFGTLSIDEIDRALRHFVKNLSGTQTNRYLYVLTRLGMVDRLNHSNQEWYFSPETFVDWRYKSDSKIKGVMGWQLEIRKEYRRVKATDNTTRKRLGALELAIERMKGGRGDG